MRTGTNLALQAIATIAQTINRLRVSEAILRRLCNDRTLREWWVGKLMNEVCPDNVLILDMHAFNQSTDAYRVSIARLSSRIDGLAKNLAKALGTKQKALLPDDYQFQHWPSGEYELKLGSSSYTITQSDKDISALEFLALAIKRDWLERVKEQFANVTAELDEASEKIA